MKRHTMLLGAGLLAVAVLGTAAIASLGDDPALEPISLTTADRGDAPHSGDASADSQDRDSVAAGESLAVDAARAEEIALDEVGPGAAVHVDIGEDDGRREWEVHVRAEDGTWWEVTIDASDGAVTETDRDGPDKAPAGQPAFGEEQARQAALDATDAAEVLVVHLDEDDGRLQWELVVRDDADVLTEVTVDAEDGRVLETEIED